MFRLRKRLGITRIKKKKLDNQGEGKFSRQKGEDTRIVVHPRPPLRLREVKLGIGAERSVIWASVSSRVTSVIKTKQNTNKQTQTKTNSLNHFIDCFFYFLVWYEAQPSPDIHFGSYSLLNRG